MVSLRAITYGQNRQLSLKVVYVVFVLFFAFFYANRYFRNGSFIPEEPYILDFSSLLRIPRNGTSIGMPFGTNGQLSIAFPWSGISLLWYKIGGDTYGHVQFILFIRTFVIVFLIQRFFRHFMTDSLALIFAALAFSTPPIKSAVLYTHWFSHVTLVLSVLLFLLNKEQKSTTRYVVQSFLITGLTVSVFSNPPHLLTAWLILPIAIVLARWIGLNDLREALKKARVLIVVGLLVYIVPAYFYLQNWSTLREANPAGMFSSRGESFINGLMGFGSWWTFGKYQAPDSTEYFYDFANFELTSTIRVAFRLLLIVLVIAYFLLQADKLNGRVLRDKSQENQTFYSLTIVSIFLVFLSSLGRFDWFWLLREMLPSVLGMFREPYPKFAPMAQIFLHATFGVSVAKLSSKYLHRRHILLSAAVVIYMIAPIFNLQPGVSVLQPKIVDPEYSWTTESLQSLEDATESLKNYSADLCLHDLDSSRLTRVFFQLRHPRLFKDLSDLVPTSELEAQASAGEKRQFRLGCQSNDDWAMVLRGKSSEVYSDQDVRSSVKCVDDSNDLFIIFRTGCIADATLRIGSDLINRTIFLSKTKDFYTVFKSENEPSWISSSDQFWFSLSTKQPNSGTISIEYTDSPLDQYSRKTKKVELPFAGNSLLNMRDFLPCFSYNSDCWSGIYTVQVELNYQRFVRSF